MRGRFRLEHGLMLGGGLILLGLIGGAIITAHWIAQGLGTLGEGQWALVAATVLVAGIQIFFTSFMLSILGLRGPR
jgi:hypothetical protein